MPALPRNFIVTCPLCCPQNKRHLLYKDFKTDVYVRWLKLVSLLEMQRRHLRLNCHTAEKSVALVWHHYWCLGEISTLLSKTLLIPNSESAFIKVSEIRKTTCSLLYSYSQYSVQSQNKCRVRVTDDDTGNSVLIVRWSWYFSDNNSRWTIPATVGIIVSVSRTVSNVCAYNNRPSSYVFAITWKETILLLWLHTSLIPEKH